jgi:hypothetical protein
MTELGEVAATLEAVVGRLVPRLLSQVCRDPGSAAHGCCDRDWWHYRIRDFPSIILQQAGYTAWLAGGLAAFAPWRDPLRDLAGAAARFWSQRAERRGAFEEYYPWEEGYPPLAFSTLAIAKLVTERVVEPGAVETGLRAAARQLRDRFESEAANQQIAGLAALAVVARASPAMVPPDDFARLRARSLALQSKEGWFAEYGGPDLGYLSVTLDCLWDLYDATADPAYVESAARALDYLAAIVAGGTSVGMHNSRNTDYVVPYGIVRFATGGGERAPLAASLFTRLYAGAADPAHFVNALDDRYVCHYSGHSLVRAAIELRRFQTSGAPEPMPGGTERRSERLFTGSGHFVRTGGDGSGARVIVSLKKGGIWSLENGPGRAADFGWVATVGDRQFVSHWWSDGWRWQRDGESFRIEGRLVPHREHLPNTAAHGALRIASFLFGRRIIGWLKRRLIFRAAESPYRFERRLLVGRDRIEVRDRIDGLPGDAVVAAAPRASKRHVSSADSFHREDLSLVEAAVCQRSSRRTADGFEAEAVYHLQSP